MKLSPQETAALVQFSDALKLGWTAEGLADMAPAALLDQVTGLATMDETTAKLIRERRVERGIMILNREHTRLGRSGYAIDPGQLPEG